MKRIIPILCALMLPAVALLAEDPRRFLEVGVDATGGVANNYFSLADFLQESLVIDLDEVLASLEGDDLTLGFDVEANVVANLNLGKNLRLGGFLGVDANVYTGIPQSIIGFLANGNIDAEGNPVETLTGSLNFRSSAYAMAGVHGYLRLGKLGLSVDPTLFVPLVYVARPTASYTLTTAADGTITASGSANVPIYSAVPYSQLESIAEEDPYALLELLQTQGGMDVSFGAEYQATDDMLFQVSLTNIPLQPAKLKYSTLLTADFSFTTTNLLQDLLDKSFADPEYGYDMTEGEDVDYEVFRPFKFGAAAVFNPGGSKLLTLRPSVAIVMYDATDYYVDYGVDGRINLANIIIVDAGMNYKDQIWQQSAGLILNIRLIEVGVKGVLQSNSILDIYSAQGFKLGVAVKVGI